MKNLSRACQYLLSPIRATDLDHKPVAFLAVGIRHTRVPNHWKRLVQIHHCKSRLLHQMGRGRAIGNNHREKGTQLCLQSIICRFIVPKALMSDNEKLFDSPKFRDFCAELGIKNYYSSSAHLQSNGKVEVTIRTLKTTLKTKLEGLKGKWVQYIPEVL